MAAINGSSIEPLSMECTQTMAELKKTAVKHMESKCDKETIDLTHFMANKMMRIAMYVHTGVFEYAPAEYDGGDEEAEMDDDPVLDTGIEHNTVSKV